MRYYIICVVYLCSIISEGKPLGNDDVLPCDPAVCVLPECICTDDGPAIPERQLFQHVQNKQDPISPSQMPQNTDSSIPIPGVAKLKLEFPSKETDVSTPILYGDDPKKSKLPPKVFPINQDKDSAGPSIVSGVDVRNTEINHSKEHKMNSQNDKVLEKVNMTLLENATKPEIPQESNDKVEQATAEQVDMLHSKYKGGQDVDELRPEKKASEKDEKKVVAPKKDPKSEVSVSPIMDKKGPKLMNETKPQSGESMLESTSKMIAVSSSVLANSQPKQHGIIEPGKTVVSVLLTAVALLCLGAVGLLVWKRIAMRRFGRDVLINEDDFDEVADMHTFDRAQIQIT